MCCFGRVGSQLRAMLYKNYLLKRRRCASTLFEVLLPVAVLALMVLLRSVIDKTDEPVKHFVSDPYEQDWQKRGGETQTFSFDSMLRNNLYENMRGFRYDNDVFEQQNVPRKMAFVPDTPQVRALVDSFVFYFPNFTDHIVFFDDEPALERYVAHPFYAFSDEYPGLYTAVVIQSWFPTFEYKLRFNATGSSGPGANGKDWPRVPDTRDPNVYPLRRKYFSEDWQRYWWGGFNSLQFFLDGYIMANHTDLDFVLGSESASRYYRVGHQGDQPKMIPPYRGGVNITPFPQAAFTNDPFATIVTTVLGVLFCIAYMHPVIVLVGALVKEKEDRIKEGMKMMGLTDGVFWASWFLTYVVVFGTSALLITIITGPTVFEFSDRRLIFLYFFVFSLDVFTLSALFSTFFSRSKIASAVSAILFFGFFFPYFAVSSPDMSYEWKLLSCTMAPTCFGLGSIQLSQFESAQQGINFGNWTTENENFSFITVIAMMALDSVVYFFLAWYIDKVFPGRYGTARPFYFLCTPRFWAGLACGDCLHGDEDPTAAARRVRKQRKLSAPHNNPVVPRSNPGTPRSAAWLGNGHNNGNGNGNGKANGASVDDLRSLDGGASGNSAVQLHVMGEKKQQHGEYPEQQPAAVAAANSHFEPVPHEIAERGGISIVNLNKVYHSDGQTVHAVKDMNLDMYEGQITVLLGHNGAGKSTLISTLVGLLPPSSGEAYVYGRTVSREMHLIRRSLGVCPQHDVLFDQLTVREHLYLFGRLKGVTDSKALSDMVEEAIEDIGLTEKRDSASSTLSGGQKRKLSIAIAMIGDSRVVFLDECTSGMDVYSRRFCWNYLLKKKRDRVIILTTHFLDEAEMLGDRVGIMAHGQMRCCGSSMFLKSLYGVGYTMTITKAPSADEQALIELVKRYVRSAEILSDNAGEISFRMPFAEAARFPSLFDAFDKVAYVTADNNKGKKGKKGKKARLNKKQLREANKGALVITYGVSVTTLEEVFLRVGKEEDRDALDRQATKSHIQALQRQRTLSSVLDKDAAAAAAAADDDDDGGGGEAKHDGNGKMPRRQRSHYMRQKKNLYRRDGSMLCKHLCALLVKRYHNAKRDRLQLIFQILLPLLITTAGLAALVLISQGSFPDQKLTTEQLDTPNRVPLTNGLANPMYEPKRTRVLRSNSDDRLSEGGGGVAADSYGNVYMVGSTEDATSFMGGGHHTPGQNGSRDVFVVKMRNDTTSTVDWVRVYGTPSNDEAYDVVVDDNNDVFVVGYTNGDLNNQTRLQNSDFGFVLKLTSAGQLLWTKLIGGSTGGTRLSSITVDPTDSTSVWATGYSYAQTHGSWSTDAAVVRLFRSNGTLVEWAAIDSIDNANEEAWGITVQGGEVYVTGWTRGRLTSNDTNLGDDDAFVACIKQMPNVTWSKQLGGTNWDKGRGIALLGSSVYAVGHTASRTFNGLEALLADAGGNQDGWMVKLRRSDGHVEFTKIHKSFQTNHDQSIQSISDETFDVLAHAPTGRLFISGRGNGQWGGFISEVRPSDGEAVFTSRIQDVQYVSGIALPHSSATVSTMYLAVDSQRPVLGVLNGEGSDTAEHHLLRQSAFLVVLDMDGDPIVDWFDAAAQNNLQAIESPVTPLPVLSKDADDYNMSNWLLETYDAYPQSRYNAFTFTTRPKYDQWSNLLYESTVFYNTTATNSVPIGINLLHNTLYAQYYAAKHGKSALHAGKVGIVVHNHPLPKTQSEQKQLGIMAAIVISIGFAFIPSTYVAYAVKERELNAKHQQMLSGVNTISYWLSSWLWDQFFYLLPAAGAIGLMIYFDVEELTGDNLPATIIGVLLYGPSITSFTYVASFKFDKHFAAQATMVLVYVFSGVIMLQASFFMDLIDKTKDANFYVKFVFRFFPNYCLGEVLLNLFYRENVAIRGSVSGRWDRDVTGYAYGAMAIGAVVYFLLVLAIERYQLLGWSGMFGGSYRPAKFHHQQSPAPEEDSDVRAERERLRKAVAHKRNKKNASDEIIRICGLRKEFGEKIAVKDLWFGVHRGEALAFLGVNGAGKTTSLQMLTGAIQPDCGTAYLNEYDIRTEQSKLRRHVGYCPQFDALVPTLTGRETLALYARLKGVAERDVGSFAQDMIELIGLSEYADRPCGGYSGGNKRKLSVGVALIGDPSVVFLDEPSTGMDPASKRKMWSLINSTMANRSLILTTHSLEESEALCQRIAIMVSGRLRCIGTAQHLKEKYGNGFQVEIKVSDETTTEQAKAFMKSKFRRAALLEVRGHYYKFKLRKNVSLGKIFATLERAKKDPNNCIVEYSCGEFSLEQVFIQFAAQADEEHVDIGRESSSEDEDEDYDDQDGVGGGEDGGYDAKHAEDDMHVEDVDNYGGGQKRHSDREISYSLGSEYDDDDTRAMRDEVNVLKSRIKAKRRENYAMQRKRRN